MRFKLLIFALMLLLTACGKNTSSKKQSSKEADISKIDAQTIMQNQFMICAEGDGKCPAGAGRSFAIHLSTPARSQMCSAFLIGPKLVMTNSHCIYSGNFSLEKTCAAMFFSFPNQYGYAYSSKCSKIIYRDPRQLGQKRYIRGDNDFALVELKDSIPLEPLKLASQDLQPGSKVYPIVGDLVSDLQGRLVKLTCKVKSISPKTGVIILEKCPIISGNSGSAVLNEKNEVVGIVFASEDIHQHEPDSPLEERLVSKSDAFAFSTTKILQIAGKHLP